MYDFRTLSPLDFEDLVRDLLQAELSVRMESFASGRDLGIDFRFSRGHDRATIVQVKHYLESGGDALIRAARSENIKVKKLAPARYILATSASLTPQLKSRLREAMPDAPLSESDIVGREDINNFLGKHPAVEKKHFKLWLASTAVLEKILHSGVYNRTQTEMDVIKSLVPKFVQNASVKRSEEILDKHRALIISGEPGVGKSTLARMLVWLHAAQNWKISVIDDIKEAFEVVSLDQNHLIFFDDFLGQVRLSPDLIRGMDQRLPPFLEKVRTSKNIRFVLTTRDYILHQAQDQSARLGGANIDALEFTLNVGIYTRGVKAKILFNHLYFSQLSFEERDALLANDYFLKIIDHRNFNPRLISLLTSPDYLALTGRPIREAIQSVLDNPQALWDIPYRTHISNEGRTLMLALFFNHERVPIPSLQDQFARVAKELGPAMERMEVPMRFRSALKELEGSIFAIQDGAVRFSNPGIRDFLQRKILEDRLLPAAVPALRDFAAVSQAWNLFSSQNPKPEAMNATERLWVEAAHRLAESETGSALSRLEIFIDMYNLLQSQGLLQPLTVAIQQLHEDELDDSEAQRSRRVFEKIILSLLPSELQKEARSALSTSVANMLSSYGGSLSLDDLRIVATALTEYGADDDLAFSSSNAAIEAHIEEMSYYISDIISVDELDTYADELNSLMRQYSVIDSRVQRRIDERREKLLQEELEEADYEPKSDWRPPTLSDDSDEAIRSIFFNLKQ